MLCSASIQETKWKPKSPTHEGPRHRSGPTAVTAANRMIAGPVKPFGRDKKLIAILARLFLCGSVREDCIASEAACKAKRTFAPKKPAFAAGKRANSLPSVPCRRVAHPELPANVWVPHRRRRSPPWRLAARVGDHGPRRSVFQGLRLRNSARPAPAGRGFQTRQSDGPAGTGVSTPEARFSHGEWRAPSFAFLWRKPGVGFPRACRSLSASR